MKKLTIIFILLCFIVAVFIACDNGEIAFVNDIKELPKGSSNWDFSLVANTSRMFGHNIALTTDSFTDMVKEWKFSDASAAILSDASDNDGDANGKNRLFSGDDMTKAGKPFGTRQSYTTKDSRTLYIGGNSEDIKYQRLTTVETP